MPVKVATIKLISIVQHLILWKFIHIKWRCVNTGRTVNADMLLHVQLFNCTCWRNGKRKTSGHGLENVNTCESSHIHQQIWKSTNVRNVKMFVWIPISSADIASWFVWQLHNFCWWRIINLQHSKCLLRFVIGWQRRSFVKVHLWHMMSNLSWHLLNIFALNSSSIV